MDRELTDSEALQLRSAPALAVSGWSGSGKTTATVEIIARLGEQGLRTSVIKHHGHADEADRPGSDTELFARAGAWRTVVRTGREQVIRSPGARASLSATVQELLQDSDLVVLEGFKTEPLAKVWLQHPTKPGPPDEVVNVLATLPWSPDRADLLLEIVRSHVEGAWQRRLVFGGVLVGGRSRRMGRPKQLLTHRGRTFYERVSDTLRTVTNRVMAIGAGPLPADTHDPRLPDVEGAAGPLAGILSALRWAPHAAWIIAASDLPHLSADAVRWMLAERAPGRWAVLPRLTPDGPIEPLLAVYEPQSRAALEALARQKLLAPRHIASLIPVATPCPPQHLHAAWKNTNTPAELVTLED